MKTRVEGLSGKLHGQRLESLRRREAVLTCCYSLKAWLVRELKKEPPRWLIPAHGDIVDLTAGPEPLRRQLG